MGLYLKHLNFSKYVLSNFIYSFSFFNILDKITCYDIVKFTNIINLNIIIVYLLTVVLLNYDLQIKNQDNQLIIE